MLGRIGEANGIKIIPFVHEQRLPIGAELGRRDSARRLEDRLRVAGTKRWQPLEELILSRRAVPATTTTSTALGVRVSGRARTSRRRFGEKIDETRTSRIPLDVSLAGVRLRTAAAATTAG